MTGRTSGISWASTCDAVACCSAVPRPLRPARQRRDAEAHGVGRRADRGGRRRARRPRHPARPVELPARAVRGVAQNPLPRRRPRNQGRRAVRLVGRKSEARRVRRACRLRPETSFAVKPSRGRGSGR